MKAWIVALPLTVFAFGTNGFGRTLECVGVDSELTLSLPLVAPSASLTVSADGQDTSYNLSLDMSSDGVGGASGDGVVLYTAKDSNGSITGELLTPESQSRIVCNVDESV